MDEEARKLDAAQKAISTGKYVMKKAPARKAKA
jgi:hypothetical protein